MHSRPETKCDSCPFAGNTRLLSIGPEDAKVILIMPGISEHDAERGRPFSGAAGSMVYWAIRDELHENPETTLRMNLVQCRPTENDRGDFERDEARFACQIGCVREISRAVDRGARAVIAFGEEMLRFFHIDGTLKKVRGSVYTRANDNGIEYSVIPTYDPIELYKHSYRKGDGSRADFTHDFICDLEKAYKVAQGGWLPPKESFNLEPSANDVRDFVMDVLQKPGTIVGVDIETSGLDKAVSEIVVIGLSCSEHEAISIPLLVKRDTPYWNPEDEREVRALLNELFSKADLAFQNCFFDVPFLRAKGFSIPYSQIKWDTMLMHAIVCPEAEHSLGAITATYGKTPYWKDTFKNRKGTIFDMDVREMREYNLRDCVVLNQNIPELKKDFDALQVWRVWEEETWPMIEPIMEMTELGVGFKFSRMESFRNAMDKALAEVQEQLYALYSLPPEFNFGSGDELRYLLFGVEPAKFAKIAELDTLKRKDTKKAQDLQALAKIREACAPRYNFPRSFVPPRTENSRKASVGKDGRTAMRNWLTARLATLDGMVNREKADAEIAQVQLVLEFLELWEEWATLEKLRSSFCDYKPGADGRIHPHWNIHGTSSGRLSSSGPNLQQLPKRGDEPSAKDRIREFFVPEEGFCLVSADFENAEVGLLGYEAQDEIIIEAYEKGYNIHDLNTVSFFGVTKDDPKWKTLRSAAKIIQFGGLSYGGGPREIYRQISLKVRGNRLTYPDLVAGIDRWMQEHVAYPRWKEALAKEVDARRIVYNEFGRVRVFLNNAASIVKEAMNFRIQSAGASILNRVMIRIHRELQRRGMRSRLIMQIHDQLVYEAPLEERDEMARLLKHEMERPFTYRGELRSLRAEVEIGEDLGNLKEWHDGGDQA